MDKGKWPLDFHELEVHFSSEGPWNILQSEGHVNDTEKAMMRRKAGFVWILLVNLHFSVSAIGVQRRKYHVVAKRFDTFVHAQYRIQLQGHHCVQFVTVDANAKVPSFLETKTVGEAHSI